VAAAAILDFQKLKILTVDLVPGANMRHHAKYHQDRSQIYGDLTVFSKWRPSAMLDWLGAYWEHPR